MTHASVDPLTDPTGLGAATPDDLPNILFILTDDQQHSTIGALGATQMRTPHIDALVARGTSFQNAYILGGDRPAVCCPSRAMINTGRKLTHLDLEGDHVRGDHAVLPETLRQRGYQTYVAGKQHNGVDLLRRGYTDGGRLMLGGMNRHMGFATTQFLPGEDRVGEPVHQDGHSTDIYGDDVVEFLQDREEGADPFFAYVAFTAPHDPMQIPQEWWDLYDLDSVEVPETFAERHPFDDGDAVRPFQSAEAMPDAQIQYHSWPMEREEIRELLRAYYAMISHVDAQIGRMVEVLEARGELDRTIIVFTADNGISMGQHGCYHKQTSYDHDVHIPLIMAGPGIPEGEVRQSIVLNSQLYATLCEMTGTRLPDTVELPSFLPTLRDDTPAHEQLYFTYMQRWRSLRRGGDHLIEYVRREEDGTAVRRTLLFDLENDPIEAHDLAGEPENAGRLEELRGHLRRAAEEHDDLDSEFWSELDAADPRGAVGAAG